LDIVYNIQSKKDDVSLNSPNTHTLEGEQNGKPLRTTIRNLPTSTTKING
jgi:hypothetical protein